jgi:hypothetical protein
MYDVRRVEGGQSPVRVRRHGSPPPPPDPNHPTGQRATSMRDAARAQAHCSRRVRGRRGGPRRSLCGCRRARRRRPTCGADTRRTCRRSAATARTARARQRPPRGLPARLRLRRGPVPVAPRRERGAEPRHCVRVRLFPALVAASGLPAQIGIAARAEGRPLQLRRSGSSLSFLPLCHAP